MGGFGIDRAYFNLNIYIHCIYCCNYMEWARREVRSPVKAVAVVAALG